MKRAIVVFALGLTVLISMGTWHDAVQASPISAVSHSSASVVNDNQVAAATAICPRYKYPNHPCQHLPTTINPVCAGITFTGTHAPGTDITCSQVPLLMNICPGERAVSISIHGTDLNLTVAGARIYKYNPATGQSYLVSAITGSGGEYTIVWGTCASTGSGTSPSGNSPTGVIQFPETGGAPGVPAAPAAPSNPYAPAGIVLLAGLVAARLLYRYRTA